METPKTDTLIPELTALLQQAARQTQKGQAAVDAIIDTLEAAKAPTVDASTKSARPKTGQTEIEAEGAKVLNERLSATLGDTVYSRNAEWLKYSQEGVIVELHLERKRLKLGLSLQDLGIEPENEGEAKRLLSILAPGHRYLLPVKVLKQADSIDSLARENLKRYGLKTFWGRFVHVKNYAAWKARNDEIRAAYMGLADEIEAQYDDLVREALEAYVGLCNGTYDRLAVSPAARRIPGFGDKQAWVTARVERMRGEIPDMAAIRASFVFTYDVTSLPSLAQIETDRVKANDIRLSEAERVMLADLERTAAARVAGGVEQFMTEVRAQVQTALFDVMTQSLKVLRGNQGKSLGRNTSVAIQKLIDATQDKLFWSEGNLEDRLRQLQAMLDTPARKRDYEEVERLLRTVGAEARLALAELEPGAQRSGLDVGIPEDIDGLTQTIGRAGAWTPPASDLTEADLTPAVRRGGDFDADDFDLDLDEGASR